MILFCLAKFLCSYLPLCFHFHADEADIKVVVLVILASDQHKEVNSRIEEIATEVKKKEKNLTGFKLEKTINKSVAMGKTVTLQLMKDITVDVTVDAKPDEQGRITLTIKPPTLCDITYACKCGKYLPIVTNQYIDKPEKQRLILAIMATPCIVKKDK